MWQIIHVTHGSGSENKCQINDQRCDNKWHPNAGERERPGINVRSQVVWPILLQNSGKKVISSSTTYSSLFLTHCPQSQCRPVRSDFVELTAELNRVVAEEEDGTWMKVRAMESH